MKSGEMKPSSNILYNQIDVSGSGIRLLIHQTHDLLHAWHPTQIISFVPMANRIFKDR